MGIGAEFIRGRTRHTRPGRAANTFSYGVDYVLVDASDADRCRVCFRATAIMSWRSMIVITAVRRVGVGV